MTNSLSGFGGPTDRSGTDSMSIFADRAHLRDTVRDEAMRAGIDIRSSADLAGLGAEGAPFGDIVLIDAPLPDAEIMATLSDVDMRAARAGQVIVSTTQDGLDAVFGCLDQSGAQILVTPGAGDRAIAIGSAVARLPGGSLNELSKEDRTALLRLTEQVSQLASKIEGLSDEPSQPAAKSTPPEGTGELPPPSLVREIIRQRHLR